MRYVQLKCLEGVKDMDAPFSYRDHLFAISRQRGRNEELDWDEMNRIQSLVKKLEEAQDGEWLVLENTEYEHMIRKLKKFSWPFMLGVIYSFIEEVSNAPSEDPRIPKSADEEAAKAATE